MNKVTCAKHFMIAWDAQNWKLESTTGNKKKGDVSNMQVS